MREIKFRAWDTKQKEMIPSESWYFNETFEPFVDSVKSCIDNGYVLMQYTGLKDKNGKEIYEGDIVLHSDGEYSISGVVVYKEGNARFIVNDRDCQEDYGDEFHEFTWQIIGNIHENPELI